MRIDKRPRIYATGIANSSLTNYLLSVNSVNFLSHLTRGKELLVRYQKLGGETVLAEFKIEDLSKKLKENCN